MPSAISSAHEVAREDFDEAVEEFMRDLPAPGNETLLNNGAPARDIDEEVTVTRKRKQVQKLDDALLLSERGIPRLRKISKDRIRFKGKGHEFSDISRLLNTYQLWLDDLYPKAKFRDALAMVEKLGHSRRMQVTRRAWIDSSKPNRAQEDEERIGDVERTSGAIGQHDENMTLEEREHAAGEEQSSGVPPPVSDAQTPEEDELDALLNGHESSRDHHPPARTSERRGPFDDDDDDEPDEDELGALLAEERKREQPHEEGNARSRPPNDDEEDELAASMGW